MAPIHEILDTVKASGTRVLVVGLGISGLESARFLVRRGIPVTVLEKQSESVFRARSKFSSELEGLRESGVAIVFGVDGEGIAPYLTDSGLVLLSPGVPIESALVRTIKRHEVPFAAEFELGLQLHRGKSVVVTGSNAKSTTSSLIDHILRLGGHAAILCGNIGVPVISRDELFQDSDGNDAVVVVEASSYQLEACALLKPSVSVVLNISENHLERHGSLERYAAAKARALRLQTADDLAVINADDAMVMEMVRGCQATHAVFGSKGEGELEALSTTWAKIASPGVGDGAIVVSRNGAREEYSTDRTKLVGAHNRYNIAAAILVARHMGVARDVVQGALDSFLPLEHRLEMVWSDGSRSIINDSKSTTVAASLAAVTTVLEHFPASRIIVMIGGLSKAGSWSPLLTRIREEARRDISVVCFGKDAPLLADHCREHGVSYVVAGNLHSATHEALQRVSAGGVALLSPGCASFDEFLDFEHRGAEFKRHVRAELGGAEGVSR
jgi:UDP-N-acetylmuramoylalanine--D-glutamate ligase